ncbi:MAG: outer membrane protein assembly factor BamD [Puniceicoccales bacterium]|jgi:outer membrane protein assembly factor BamD|nr:outer membrane protein assembly factor BamD [Puniceicoccales bacterium]
MRKYITFLTVILSLTYLNADLIWTRESGWQPTPDIASKFHKEPSEALQLMNDAREFQEDGHISIALTGYKNVCKKFPNTIFAPEAYHQIGKIKMSKKQFNDAFKAFTIITKKYPEYPHFNDVLHEKFEIARLLKSGERPKYFGLIPGFKDYQSSINFYKKIIADAPFSEIAPLALIHIGNFAISKDHPLDAIAAFEQLIDEFPYSEYTPEAYLKLADIYAKMTKSPFYDQGATKLAINYYEDFLTLYPNHEDAARARATYDLMKTRLAESKLFIGDFYFNAKNNGKAAIIMYNKMIHFLPDSEIAHSARKKIEYIRAGNLPKATPIDFLFGKCQRSTDDQLANLPPKDTPENSFDFQNDLIQINTDDNFEEEVLLESVDSKIKPAESFIKIGPNKEF